MEASVDLIQQLLKDLSSHERRDAVTMFAVIGMVSYLQRHKEDVTFCKSMIKIEHGKCYSILLKHCHQHLKRKGKTGTDKRQLPQAYKKSIDINSQQSRRHDGMKHFPFVDEFGSVVDVLAELSVASRPTLPAAMEDPVLTHTITKVYNEFKIGRNGMKASDVPEALLNIRTQRLNYPFLQQSSPSDTFQEESLAAHRLISLAQWTQIVRKRVLQFLSGESGGKTPVDGRVRASVDLPEDEYVDVGPEGLFDEEEEEDIDIYDEEEWVMPPAQVSSIGAHVGGEGAHSGAEQPKRGRNRGRSRPCSQQQHPTPAARASVMDATRVRSEALQQVARSSVTQKSFKLPAKKKTPTQVTGSTRSPGSAHAQIMADKRHARRVKTARQTAAIRALASSRVAHLPDEGKGCDEAPGLTSWSGSGSGKKKPAESVRSGSAALDIASAFLSGSLGKQLLAEGKGEYEWREVDVGESEGISEEAQELEQEGSERGVSSGSGSQDGVAPPSRYADYSGRDKYQSCAPLYDQQRGGKDRGRRGEDEKEKRYFADHWRSTRGGWVADFGPPHTHTLQQRDEQESNDDFE